MAECIAAALFVLKSQLGKQKVLKMATYLCFHSFITKREVALLLRVQRQNINSTLSLGMNNLFREKELPLDKWGSGGREKRIKLSEGAEQYKDLIIALAKQLLSEKDFEECKTKIITL